MNKQTMVSSKSGLPCKSVPFFKADAIFAWIYFLVGYGFIYAFFSEYCERSFAIYTVVYIAVVMAYVLKKGLRPSKESYFWLCVMLAIALPSPFWSIEAWTVGFPYPLQLLALMPVAAYWTLSVTGALSEGCRTSQWVAADLLNALFIVPLANFTCHIHALKATVVGKEDEEQTPHRLGAVLLGLAIAMPLLIIILPLLASADAGFERIVTEALRYMDEHFLFAMFRILLSLPVTAYLFGLVYGGIYKRNTDFIDKESIRKAGHEIRIIPNIAVCTALLCVCAAYLLFMLFQANYLFSAFRGTMPGTYTYAEYARRGFFELCAIAVFNLLMLFGANLFSAKERAQSRFLRLVNRLAAVFTLLLIATAMSKMVLYIGAYGLTIKRVLSMAFMLWLAITFSLIIPWQKRHLPIIRISVMAGAVIFCLLCVIPVDKCVILYNTRFAF